VPLPVAVNALMDPLSNLELRDIITDARRGEGAFKFLKPSLPDDTG
jgi:hypothetical protein